MKPFLRTQPLAAAKVGVPALRPGQPHFGWAKAFQEPAEEAAVVGQRRTEPHREPTGVGSGLRLVAVARAAEFAFAPGFALPAVGVHSEHRMLQVKP